MKNDITISMGSTSQDQRHIALCGTELLGDVRLLHFSSESSDFGYFGRSQQFLESFDEAGVNGVLFVGSVISPFEIDDDIVSLVPINVIDERKTNWVGNKGECDKSVDKARSSFAFFKQCDLHVTEFMKGGLYNLPIATLWPMPCFSHPIDASDISEVADFVKAFEAKDCSPLFFNHDVASLQLTGIADHSYTQSVVQ